MHSALKKAKHPRIALVVVYIGPAPFWMPAFLLSCRFNPQVHWIFFTDMPTPPDCPENVSFIRMGLSEFNQLATRTLHQNIQVQPSLVYKICDLRPAFGVIFKNYLESFDFWGYCDLDVVWGDIIGVLGIEVFTKHDIVTSRVGRISGHFCLFRNTDEIATTYKWIPCVKKMMSSTRHYAIDEDHLTDYLHVHNNPNWVVRLKQFFLGKQPLRPKVYWDRVLTTSGAHQRSMGKDTNRYWLWKDGRTYDADGQEMMYLHFHKIKQTMTGINFGYRDRPKEFLVTPEGIVTP